MQRKLKDSVLVLCPACYGKAFGTIDIPLRSEGVKDDLNLVQVGTTGTYRGKKFEIVGRICIVMEDDRQNLWCASYDDPKSPVLWINQSFDSLSFAADTFHPFPPKSDLDLKAGGKAIFGEKLKMYVSLVSKCREIQYEGEVARFPKPDGNFLFIHAANNSNTALIICIDETLSKSEMLWAETMRLNEFQFENTRKFDDWPQ